MKLTSLPPLSLYIHFPWCIKKCPYCDFNSHQVKNTSGDPSTGFDETRYLHCLREDLSAQLASVWGRRVHSVFIGGGTPSLISPTGIAQLMSDIRALLPINADAEITLEANPGTFEQEKFQAFKDAGVNRLSIGVQSFNDTHLQSLGRVHNSEMAQAAIQYAQSLFDEVNIDLMYALPQQSLAMAKRDIETAISFQTSHLSLYHLTLEPNTYFAKYPPVLPEDDLAHIMQEELMATIAAAGYERYEVSAYAKKGSRCQHNMNYWQFGDYLGIGAGAHGKISSAFGIRRTTREKHPESYMQQMEKNPQVFIEERELDRHDLPFEFMLNSLRLVEGVPTEYFKERTGLEISVIQREIQEALRKNLLDEDPRYLKASPLGMQYLNELQMLFLK